MGFGKNALQNKKFRAKVDLMGTAFNGDKHLMGTATFSHLTRIFRSDLLCLEYDSSQMYN